MVQKLGLGVFDSDSWVSNAHSTIYTPINGAARKLGVQPRHRDNRHETARLTIHAVSLLRWGVENGRSGRINVMDRHAVIERHVTLILTSLGIITSKSLDAGGILDLSRWESREATSDGHREREKLDIAAKAVIAHTSAGEQIDESCKALSAVGTMPSFKSVDKRAEVERGSLDGQDASNDARAVPHEHAVLVVRIHNGSRTAVDAAELNQRGDIHVEQDLVHEFVGQVVERAEARGLWSYNKMRVMQEKAIMKIDIIEGVIAKPKPRG